MPTGQQHPLGNEADTCQIVNPKGEMKGSAITGPVGKEAADLWPVRHPSFISSSSDNRNTNSTLPQRIASNSGVVM